MKKHKVLYNKTMTNTNNMDIRAGAFCDIKVNCSWWNDRITDCAYIYVEKMYDTEPTINDWFFNRVSDDDDGSDVTYEEMFWKEWNDQLQSYLTKMLMN